MIFNCMETTAIFHCTYDTTTYAEITQALAMGKLPVCKRNDRLYIYNLSIAGNCHMFSSVAGEVSSFLRVDSSNGYSIGMNTLEVTSGKVTALSSGSTNAQYPSAKCVYDNLKRKAPAYQYSTTDLTAGTSPLETGTLYFVYE